MTHIAQSKLVDMDHNGDESGIDSSPLYGALVPYGTSPRPPERASLLSALAHIDPVNAIRTKALNAGQSGCILKSRRWLGRG